MEPSPIHGSSSDERSQSAPAPTLVRAVATGSFRQYLPADLLFNGLSRRLSHDAGVHLKRSPARAIEACACITTKEFLLQFELETLRNLSPRRRWLVKPIRRT